MKPDFLFFANDAKGNIIVDLVDPHGHYLADALPKLQGLARYASKYGEVFRRNQSVAELNGSLKVLALKDETVRKMIVEASNAKSLYAGPLAIEYGLKDGALASR